MSRRKEMSAMPKWMPFKRGEKKTQETSPAVAGENPLMNIHREIDNVFQQFFRGGLFGRPLSTSLFEPTESFFGDFSPEAFTPTIDLADKKKELVLTAELPGLDPDDVDIEVKDGYLVLKGEKRTEETSEDENGFWRTERSFGAFQRAIPLPAEVDPDHAEADFTKGVLKVRLPKRQVAAEDTKRITVKGR
ncbi:MAG TPA: Hsp20/alpha crystallin family protein [Planctomycetes bacterium]|nr:Hsp20/alpha crystallin family protein [Planctomycetota bacterium]